MINLLTTISSVAVCLMLSIIQPSLLKLIMLGISLVCFGAVLGAEFVKRA